jgi:hypothetical protein
LISVLAWLAQSESFGELIEAVEREKTVNAYLMDGE